MKTTAQWTQGLDGSRNAQLLCEVYGADPRNTIWLHSDGSSLLQGKSLHLSVDGNNHTARFNSVSNLDYDNYTCASQNEYGLALSTVEISGESHRPIVGRRELRKNKAAVTHAARWNHNYFTAYIAL